MTTPKKIDYMKCNFNSLYKSKDAAEAGRLVTDSIIEEITTIQGMLDMIEDTAKDSVTQAIEVGKLLLSLKDDDDIVHGAWQAYVERFITKPTGIPYKTLSTWMKFAKNEQTIGKAKSFAEANRLIAEANGTKRGARKVSHDERIQKACTALVNALDEANGAELSVETIKMLNVVEVACGAV